MASLEEFLTTLKATLRELGDTRERVTDLESLFEGFERALRAVNEENVRVLAGHAEDVNRLVQARLEESNSDIAGILLYKAWRGLQAAYSIPLTDADRALMERCKALGWVSREVIDPT